MKLFLLGALITLAHSCILQINHDITPGRHLAVTEAKNAYDCCDKCLSNPSCLGFVFVVYRDDDTELNCYLKDTAHMQRADATMIDMLASIMYAGSVNRFIPTNTAQNILTMASCEQLNTGQGLRAKFVCFGGLCKCWHTPGQGGVHASARCDQFPNGQLINLDSTEAEHLFTELLKSHGASSSWTYWIGGMPSTSPQSCNVYQWGRGREITSCHQNFGYYCEYPVV